jgi:hypothetical protein
VPFDTIGSLCTGWKPRRSLRATVGAVERAAAVVLLAMQKVEGSNPFSRSENPRICGGFSLRNPDHRLTRHTRVNRLQSGVQR